MDMKLKKSYSKVIALKISQRSQRCEDRTANVPKAILATRCCGPFNQDTTAYFKRITNVSYVNQNTC